MTHRCWPSRAGWGLAAFLAAYAIFMHSFHEMSHSKQEKVVAALAAQAKVSAQRFDGVEQRLESIRQRDDEVSTLIPMPTPEYPTKRWGRR